MAPLNIEPLLLQNLWTVQYVISLNGVSQSNWRQPLYGVPPYDFNKWAIPSGLPVLGSYDFGYGASIQFCPYVGTRVARWFVFKPKIPMREKNSRASYCKMLVYLMAIWNIS
jgi:hypothetical protein